MVIPEPNINGFHIPNLELIRRMAKEDGFSPLVIYDGQERGGKSTTMSHDALFIDPTIYKNIKRVAFNIKQVEEAIEDAKKSGPGSVVVIDEAANVLLSKDGRSKFVVQLEKLLMMNGKYNIIYLLAIPSLFDLTPYIRIHRADCLIHVVVRDEWDDDKQRFEIVRGRFNAYSHSQMVRMQMKAEHKYDMSGAKYNYFGFWNKTPLPTDIYGEVYETKKDAAIKEVCAEKDKPKKDDRYKLIISRLNKLRKKQVYIDDSFIAEISNLAKNTTRLIKINEE